MNANPGLARWLTTGATGVRRWLKHWLADLKRPDSVRGRLLAVLIILFAALVWFRIVLPWLVGTP